MQYIKHNNKFYREIELKDLDKKELIKLITEAIEVNPKIVERFYSYPRWNNTFAVYTGDSSIQAIGKTDSITSGDIMSGTSAASSEYPNGIDYTKINTLSQDNLITLCSVI